MSEMTEAYQWHDRTMIGSDGEKIGKITEVYEDPETGKPEWATVSSGLFGTRSNFVPLAGAAPAGEDVRASVTKDQVKDAPGVEAGGELSEQEEQALFEHYGVPYTTAGSTTAEGGPATGQRGQSNRGSTGRDVSGPETDEAMTRSEEELRVGTREREAGRARLRKYVVTESVTQTVPGSARKFASSVSRSPTPTATRPCRGPISPRRSTRSSCTRRSPSSRSASSPRNGCAWTPRPSVRSARSQRKFARSRSIPRGLSGGAAAEAAVKQGALGRGLLAESPLLHLSSSRNAPTRPVNGAKEP